MTQIKGGPHLGHAAGDTDIEKQASQLASDVKYKVRKGMKEKSGSKLSPAQVVAAYQAQLAKSVQAGTPRAVVELARRKLMGSPKAAVRKEEFDSVKDLANDSISSALYKVFVEGNKEEKAVDPREDYLQELAATSERKFHIRVTDASTGNTYYRYATRSKVNELRANPHIKSVEMLDKMAPEYGQPSKSEKEKGEQTARVKSGKGLDPVGKEDSDVNNDKKVDKQDKYLLNRRKEIGKAMKARMEALDPVGQEDDDIDNDGKKNTKTDRYLKNRRNAVGKAIATQKEEFLGEVNKDSNDKKITGKGVDNYASGVVKIAPPEPDMDRPGVRRVNKESVAFAKFISAIKLDEKMNLAKADMGDVVTDFQTSDAPQFKGKSKKKRQQMAIAAKLGAERKAGMKEDADCGCQDAEPKLKKKEGGVDDPRAIPTKVNLVKNKLRSMGLKMSYEPEGEVIGEEESDRRRDRRQEAGGVSANADQRPERPAPAPGTQRKRKRRSSAPSAMDIVRQSVIDKYGPKSIL